VVYRLVNDAYNNGSVRLVSNVTFNVRSISVGPLPFSHFQPSYKNSPHTHTHTHTHTLSLSLSLSVSVQLSML